MALVRPKSYQVLITPLVGRNTYGTTQDVTLNAEIDDFVRDGGVSSIRGEIDNGDFDFGVFVFDSINLTCINLDGKFAGPNDSRSMFRYTRDKARIIVNYFDGESNTPTLSFRGLIDDRATKINFGRNEVKFKVLSNDSIINRTKIASGTVRNGGTTTEAIKSILNVSDITAVLNYNESDITPLNEYTIDNGSFFDNKTVKDGLDALLAVSNSVLLVDRNTDNIFVRSRNANSGSVKNLFGHGDLFGRENIIDIRGYNDGLQRAFNTINIGSISATNSGYVEQYGDNPKTFDFGFITNDTTRTVIANNLLDYWKTPKIELQAVVKTDEVRGLDYFDLVSIDYPYRLKPFGDNKLPIYGVSQYGQAVYPYISGNLKIRPNVAFKVVGLREDPRSNLTTVKLRQVGVNIDDGYFGNIGTFYGTASYGNNVYQFDPDRLDPNRISVYGAAKFGTVIYRNV